MAGVSRAETEQVYPIDAEQPSATVFQMDEYRPHGLVEPPVQTPDYSEDLKRIENARRDPDELESLLKGFQDLVAYKARIYYLPGGETADLLQEGMIGLYKSVLAYDGTRSSFRNFAEVCITRQLITAVKTATRNKHGPLNTSVSYELPAPGVGDDSGPVLKDVLAEKAPTPEEQVVGKEISYGLLGALATRLSDMEIDVLRLFINNNETYDTIAEQLGINKKQVDNAMHRVKMKIKSYFDSQDYDLPVSAKLTRSTG